MNRRKITTWLILITGLLIPLSLQAQIASPWLQTTPTTVTFGVDSDGVLFSMGTFGASLTFSTQENSSDPQLLWVPAWSAFRVGSFSSAPTTSTMGDYSVAMGENAAASGSNAMAVGSYATASGYASTALGEGAAATGYWSLALGVATSASNTEATALGTDTSASGQYSTAIGLVTTASATYSTAAGFQTLANSCNSFVIGTYNLGLNETSGTPSLTTWNGADPLFEIGNGSSTTPSDAFVVYKDGSANLKGTLIVAPGGDLSMGSFTAGTTP